MNGYVEVHTLYIQAEHEVLWSDDGLEDAKIFVGPLALDRCLVEDAEVMHDALLALVRKRVNSRSGEEVFAPRSKVLIRPDPSALEKILNREIHILRVDEFRRRRFRLKGKTLLELDLDSMFDPTKDLLGSEVLWLFPPCQPGLEIGRVKQTWNPRVHVPDSLS
jgi:hypothetical protein